MRKREYGVCSNCGKQQADSDFTLQVKMYKRGVYQLIRRFDGIECLEMWIATGQLEKLKKAILQTEAGP